MDRDFLRSLSAPDLALLRLQLKKYPEDDGGETLALVEAEFARRDKEGAAERGEGDARG